MDETMLRSGVPPHMGQSPLPGSEAARCAGRVPATAARISASSNSARRDRRDGDVVFLVRFVLMGVRLASILPLLVCGDLEIVQVSAELSVHKQPRRPLAVPDR